MHGIALSDHRLQVELCGAGLLQPEQKAGQRGRLLQASAMPLVGHRQIEERIQIALALTRGGLIRSPGRHHRARVRLIERAGNDLYRRAMLNIVSQRGQPSENGVVRLRPAARVTARREVSQPMREPVFRLQATGQRQHLGRGNGIAGIVHPLQTSPRQRNFGGIQQTLQRKAHRNPAEPQRSSQIRRLLVRSGEHRNVRPHHLPRDLWIFRVCHERACADEIQHRRGERKLLCLAIFTVHKPALHGRVVGRRLPLRLEHHLLRLELIAKRRAEELVEKLHDGVCRAPVLLEAIRLSATFRQGIERSKHEIGIAAAKSIDRLLHVADEDHAPGKRHQLQEEGQLHGAGVLKLIH